ncbi:MAG: transposase [Desulfobacteraceae bacterium]|nr:transposase [Desulfobacteraceae bacterium]
MINSCEVADIFSTYGRDYRNKNLLSYKKLKVMNRISVCRTAQLGGQIEKCDQCGFERNAYNSCRDRVAISNNRIKSIDNGQVCFEYSLQQSIKRSSI